MIKKYCVLLFILCLSMTKSAKSSLKNLRNLSPQVLSYSGAGNLAYDESDKKLKFVISLNNAEGISPGTYQLSVYYRGEKTPSTCRYDSGTSLSCEIDCVAPYYASIQLITRGNGLSSDTITLSVNTYERIKQEGQSFSLTYKEAVIGLNDDGKSYDIQVYLDDSSSSITLEDNTYLDMDIDIGTGYSIAGCAYSSSLKMLNCKSRDTSSEKISIISEKKEGTIQWIGGIDDSTVKVKIKAATNIYGYNLKFEESKWKFNLYIHSSDITFSGYSSTLNVILKNKDNVDSTQNALCERKNPRKYECIVSDGTQDIDDFVYISPVQTGATISFKNNFLTAPKLMIREITLKYVEAYDFKFENSKWKFKIKIEAVDSPTTKIRDGLNVTVALYREGDGYHTASCINENNILSCIRDKDAQYNDDSISLSPKKSVGSVTWSNLDEEGENIKIPLVITLSHSSSYFLAYKDSKWTFKMDVKPTESAIPSKSLIKIDILYDGAQYTTADCNENKGVSRGYVTTFTCHCDTLDASKTFQISNIKKEASINWSGLEAPVSIDKRNEFEFVKAYNMELNYISTSDHKWHFDIEFNDVEGINPTVSDIYSIDLLYTSSPTSSKIKGSAKCSLKEGTTNIFSCICDTFTNNMVKDVVLYICKTTTKTSKFIQWTGIEEDYQMPLNAQFTLEKGIIKYNSKWLLNIKVKNPKDGILPQTSKLVIDIKKDSNSDTINCIVKSNLLLECDTGIVSNSLDNLPIFSIPIEKSDSATAKFLNTDFEDNFYILYLETQLTFSSAKNMNFNGNNKWQFDLIISEALKEKNRMIIDVLCNNVPSTAICVKSSTINCIVNYDSQTKSQLVKISKTKTTSSTITWKSLSVDKDIIMNAELNVESAKHLAFEEIKNKWQFNINLLDSDLPLNSVVQVDIIYNSSPSTATCTHKTRNILTCIPDIESQQKSHTLTISHTKTQGSVTYSSIADKLQFESSIELTYKKAKDFILNGNNWEFEVELDSSNNIGDGGSVSIDIKLNNNNNKAQCTLNGDTLRCTTVKQGTDDRIILINNRDNQDLIWANLNNDVELYVKYEIKYINYYGAFYKNKWLFNMKYEHTTNTIEANNNYVLLDILVNDADNIAKCQITQNLLLCESQHFDQNKNDQIKLKSTVKDGTVILSNLPDTIEALTPISISMEYTTISNFDSSNGAIKFKINGNLKNNAQTSIDENTITQIELLVKDALLDAICYTNNINNSPIVLSCEASGSINTQEDDVKIKVDSNGKSKYVTFYSVTENINVFTHGQIVVDDTSSSEEKDNTKNNSDNNKGNNGFIIINNYNYMFLFGLFLLF